IFKGAYTAEIKIFGGKTYAIRSVVSSDEKMDLIELLVDIPEQIVQWIEITVAVPSVAERIIVVGSPMGLEQTVTEGIISAIRYLPDFGSYYQISAPISPGSSGSPVINMEGKVIGIATFQIVDGQNLNFALPSKYIKDTDKMNIDVSLQEWTSLNDKAGIKEFKKDKDQHIIQTQAKQWFHRGLFFDNSQNYEKALWAYTKALELDPRYISAYHNRGNVWREIGDFDRSYNDFNKIIELDSNIIFAYIGRGNALSDKGKYLQAVQDYNSCLLINPNFAEAYHNRGYAWMELKKYDKAISDFEKALQLKPQYTSVYIHRAIIWGKIGDYDRAISDETKAIQINPLSKIAYKNRGNSFLRKFGEGIKNRVYDKGLVDQAIADFKRALRIDPNYTDAYHDLQLAYKMLQLLNQ
ncbi:tetratricopeptide repeat protein, partial [bacterium]|nr:tetratricopeptide repeat protein [bacterium]